MFEKGRRLSEIERQRYQPYFAKIVLEKARIVENKVPFWLRRDMSAVVLGHRVYFRQGVYQANTISGIKILGHELTHVSQFLHGMTVLGYLWSCRKGYANSHYEIDAYAKGHMIAMNLTEFNSQIA